MKIKEYALYKGDTFIDLGTTKYLSEKYEIKEQTIRKYSCASYRTRSKEPLICIRLEDDEDVEN